MKKAPLKPTSDMLWEKALASVDEEVGPEDQERFQRLTSIALEDWQIAQVVTPERARPRQGEVLAVHWHPEFVPLELISRRLDALYPRMRDALVIPTQHNELTEYGEYAGVEVDCYSHGFNRKVQLLLHMTRDKAERAGVLKSLLRHTFKYRSSQLFDFLRTITRPVEPRLERAARQTGADADLAGFVRLHAAKIEKLLEEHDGRIPEEMLKNKLLRNWFDDLRPHIGDPAADRVQVYLGAVKAQVKAAFSLKYFYRASEIIEEARSLGCGVVIPHPEQFWPILLADYDVDGIEVWNPQSREYTEFLISVVADKNRRRGPGRRELLVLMGDDCHMGEKTRPVARQDKEKAGREIGLQNAWDDLNIRKRLIVNGLGRAGTIREYRDRLAG